MNFSQNEIVFAKRLAAAHYPKYLQDNIQETMWKARDVAEGLFINPRAVSGAMRKLVSDGYIEKMGQDPVIYSLTEKGKNIKIED